MAKPNTVTMQCIVLFSHGTRQQPNRTHRVRQVRGAVGVPSPCAAAALTILLRVPVHASRGMQPSAILLHNDASHNVLEGFLKFLKALKAVVSHLIGPIIHFLCIVHVL